ncbi:unnamed protein product, partial [Nesidiocoris tenuis]
MSAATSIHTTAPTIDNNNENDKPKSMLVMSGGEGYIDFRVGDDEDDTTEPKNPLKSDPSYLIVWQVPGKPNSWRKSSLNAKKREFSIKIDVIREIKQNQCVIVIFNQQFLLVPTNHIQKRLTNHFSVKFFIVLYPLKPVGLNAADQSPEQYRTAQQCQWKSTSKNNR